MADKNGINQNIISEGSLYNLESIMVKYIVSKITCIECGQAMYLINDKLVCMIIGCPNYQIELDKDFKSK
jgi:Zn finger protein HypA/HybF involved in hydrogenase expression